MELKQLRYFVAVAEELHFGNAAKRLAISQPPLSFNIARLEESLGYLLLRRSTREVALTPAGMVFYQEACRILALASQAQQLGQRAAEGELGSLRVGFVGAALLTPIANHLRRFEMQRSGVMISAFFIREQFLTGFAARCYFASPLYAPCRQTIAWRAPKSSSFRR